VTERSIDDQPLAEETLMPPIGASLPGARVWLSIKLLAASGAIAFSLRRGDAITTVLQFRTARSDLGWLAAIWR